MNGKILLRFFALLLICIFLTSCTGTSDNTDVTSADSTAAPVAEEPVETHEIYEEIIGSVRVQLYSTSVLRIEESDSTGVFCDANTIAVTNRSDWPGVEVDRSEADGNIILKTSGYTVTVPADAKDCRGVIVNDTNGNSAWKYRKSASATVSLPEPADTPSAWSFSDCPRVIVPENGFTRVINEPENGFTYNSNISDNYVFVCNGDPFSLRADYNKLVGPCDMVTIKTLGLWFSRYHAYTDKQFLHLVDGYRQRGYPLDYVVCDTDWKMGGSTGYDINQKYFPDMEGFLAQMHEKNISIAFNDHVREYSGSVFDEEQITWFNKNLTDKLNLGLDTWWYDRNWNYFLNSPFENIHSDMLGQMLYQSISKAHDEPLNKRTVMLSNYYNLFHGTLKLPSCVGTHRLGVQWSGDISSKMLPTELENMVNLGARTSSAYISSDIGGHHGMPTNSAFIRWTQFGALSPIMRYHSSKEDRSPWRHGETADEVARTYINMRYRLMPVYYTLAYENHALGLPMARRLDFYYPQYSEAKAADQYLLGDDILVAPITNTQTATYSIPDDWFKTPDGKPGVSVKYYNNKDLSGEVVAQKIMPNVDFNCGTGSPAPGVNSDQFSAVMEATLTVGDLDIYFSTISDDGVRVYVDGRRIINFWEPSDSSIQTNKDYVFKANTSHELRIEYFDDAGGALLNLFYTPNDLESPDITDERTVFIPDGTWMDVFTGERYTGPKTITVKHSLKTSPLFVKIGSINALAHKAEYASTDDWSRLVLDVYPENGLKDTSVLYEDDGATLDYQSGSFRKTALSAHTENSVTTVKIGAAEGQYETQWKEREWTLRVHSSDVSSVTVNGNEAEFTVVQKDPNAAPFATEGGSPDGDVVTVKFNAPINSESVIVVK